MTKPDDPLMGFTRLGFDAFLSNDAGVRRVTELRVLILDDLEL
jgi:hypothetical protein